MEAYKGSQFNLFMPLENSEECLIFNTFTGSEVVVDRHLKAIIENGPGPLRAYLLLIDPPWSS